MDFPHLQDTQFPHLQNENVYAFKNTFDYSRWNENTIVRLVNVLWDSSLNDAPLFERDEERDAWFDALTEGYALRLETAARIVPEGYVKLPLPYDVAARYNYLYVEVPYATGDEFIEYEQEYGIRRWYFFIDRIEYGAPNSTHVYVTNDFWTTFQNDVEIKYMLLERGHAPLAYAVFLHHWGIYSVSPFVPAILFTTSAGTSVDTYTQSLSAITASIEDSTPHAGESTKITVALTGTLVDGDSASVIGQGVVLAPTAVTYDVAITRSTTTGTGNDAVTTTESIVDPRTYVDEYGVLHVGKGLEVGDVITVLCTSTYVNPSGSTTAMSDDVTATID